MHARLVLVHVAERDRALRALTGALRPGGWLAIEDADPALQPLAILDVRGPRDALANRRRNAFRAMLAERGADLAYGRKLPRLLRLLRDPGCAMSTPMPTSRSPIRRARRSSARRSSTSAPA